jgi:hypothetical protein
MPLYFPRVRNGDAHLPDESEAQEFAFLDNVRGEVTENARQILSAAALMETAASLNLKIEVMERRL